MSVHKSGSLVSELAIMHQPTKRYTERKELRRNSPAAIRGVAALWGRGVPVFALITVPVLTFLFTGRLVETLRSQ